MNTDALSPGGLRPFSSASPTGSNNTGTGRPPLWNSSSQRKVSRLYLYTTLTLQQIIDVVHAKSPDTASPGKDSANKKLNKLLDKEPRWLHPRSESDMGRRLEELSLSPTRTTQRPHANSDPAPVLDQNPNPFKREMPHSPDMLLVPPFAHFAPGNRLSTGSFLAPTPTQQNQQPSFDQQDNGSPMDRFLRRSTILSSSTDRTTGTFHRVLQGYSDQYVKTVRRLVKRYTAPNCQDANSAFSPISEDATPNSTWLTDPDRAPCLPNRPYHLPGDFLNLDQILRVQPRCFNQDELHSKRSCFCYARDEIERSPWVTAAGLTEDAQNILHHGIANQNLADRDDFGNTMLHFMAARAPIPLLLNVVYSGHCDPILGARNTAGQTFLHLLSPASLQDHDSLFQLLKILSHKGFDVYTCDVYGRSFFHMMLLTEDDYAKTLLQFFDSDKYMRRDAFNIIPSPHTEPTMGISHVYTQAMDLDPPQNSQTPARFGGLLTEEERNACISQEARLLETVREAESNPKLEDSEGRNGLHCLAAATLSQSSLLKKYGLAPPQRSRSQRGKKNQEPKDLDSSAEKLCSRLATLNRLLLAKVDPNHYDNEGNTPLMAFAAQLPEDDDYKFGPRILESLIKAGAEVNARNRRGETALHIAVRCGRKLAARTLFNFSANVHVRDAAGRSVLEVADVKTQGANCVCPKEYVHYEACRAWLSGRAFAVQEPTVLQEWGLPPMY